MEPELWREKCKEIIADLSWDSYRAANYLPNGRKRKRHVPYSVPADATMLVKCLDYGDEETAKAYFIKRAEYGDEFRENI